MDLELQKTKKIIRRNINDVEGSPSLGKEDVENMPSKNSRRSVFPWLLSFVLLIALCVLGFLYYRQYVKPLDEATQIEALTTKTISKLSKHIVLPTTKPEVVFPITDIENLKKTQSFFDGAQNGNILVVYSNPPQAIIYDPEQDLIIKIGPVTFEQPKTDVPAPKATSTKK